MMMKMMVVQAKIHVGLLHAKTLKQKQSICKCVVLLVLLSVLTMLFDNGLCQRRRKVITMDSTWLNQKQEQQRR